MDHGVECSLTGGAEYYPEVVVYHSVSHHDDLDRDMMHVFDFGQLVLESNTKGRGSGCRFASIQPIAQLAFLLAGKRDNTGVIGAALDQGQRLENRIMEVRSDLRALI